MDDGKVVEGVPSATAEPTDDEDEVDHTGVRRVLLIDRTPVEIDHVRSYSVTRPA